MRVKIYQPAKNTMQSGNSKDDWLIQPEINSAKKVDALTGWSGSKDTTSQIYLRFPSKEEAVAYASKKGWSVNLIETSARNRRPNIRRMGYAENFATNRRSPWTH